MRKLLKKLVLSVLIKKRHQLTKEWTEVSRMWVDSYLIHGHQSEEIQQTYASLKNRVEQLTKAIATIKREL